MTAGDSLTKSSWLVVLKALHFCKTKHIVMKMHGYLPCLARRKNTRDLQALLKIVALECATWTLKNRRAQLPPRARQSLSAEMMMVLMIGFQRKPSRQLMIFATNVLQMCQRHLWTPCFKTSTESGVFGKRNKSLVSRLKLIVRSNIWGANLPSKSLTTKLCMKMKSKDLRLS